MSLSSERLIGLIKERLNFNEAILKWIGPCYLGIRDRLLFVKITEVNPFPGLQSELLAEAPPSHPQGRKAFSKHKLRSIRALNVHDVRSALHWNDMSLAAGVSSGDFCNLWSQQ